jgi:hypothetical protein
MSPESTKAIKRYALAAGVLAGGFVLYALSLGPVLWLFDTRHAAAGYNSLPPAVRLLYSPLQRIPWPGVYCQYLEAGFRPVHKPYVPTEAERTAWPKTVDEAVTRLLAGMDDADKARVRDTKKADLILFHHGWGTGIRNDFGLWRGNTSLMTDCHTRIPDEASMAIIEAVWQRLQKP